MRTIIILLSILLASCSGNRNSEPTLGGKEKYEYRPAPTATPHALSASRNVDDPPAAASVEERTRSDIYDKSYTIKLPKKTKESKSTTPLTQDSIFAQLANASIVFSLPKAANIKDDIRARVLIDVNQTADELARTVESNIRIKDNVRVSKILIAKLIAPDFIVTPITPEEQALTQDEPTEWIWELDAKEAGTYTANLVITAVVKVDEKTSVHHIKTFSRELTIEVLPKQRFTSWLERYWQWCLSSMIIPVLAWVAKLWFTKSNKKEETVE